VMDSLKIRCAREIVRHRDDGLAAFAKRWIARQACKDSAVLPIGLDQ
jgi:hypothetical protein